MRVVCRVVAAGVAAGVVAAGLVACGTGEPRPATSQPAALQAAAAQAGDVARARAALMPLKKGLKSALMGAIQSKGPVAAGQACKLEAPRITAAAEVDGIRVGRASDKLRNPANAAPAWVKPHLAAWLAAAPAPGVHVTQPLPDGRRGYLEPIFVQPPCLLCHGAEVPAPIRESLSALYPTDQATGYALGQVRGVFWVDLPPAR
jgi:hypothetical protein